LVGKATLLVQGACDSLRKVARRGDAMNFELPDSVVDVIAQRAAEMAIETLGREGSPWLTRQQAARYLSLPVSRLEKDRTIPCHRPPALPDDDGLVGDGRRVLYHRGELDRWLLES
jgi:hypothetical protein